MYSLLANQHNGPGLSTLAKSITQKNFLFTYTAAIFSGLPNPFVRLIRCSLQSSAQSPLWPGRY